MNKKEIKEIKEQMYYLDSELYSYQDIDNLKEYAKNLKKENQQLKKQKDDVIELIKKQLLSNTNITKYTDEMCLRDLLRMLGETDE